MTKEELSRILDLGSHHSVTVDLREDQIPGLMRIVTIYQGSHLDDSARVSIEWISTYVFLNDPAEQGVLKCIGQYEDRDIMIADMEEYLSLPMELWRDNLSSRFEPHIICDDSYTPETMKRLEELVRTHALPLPNRTCFRFSDIYWDQISRFGEFRGPFFEQTETN